MTTLAVIGYGELGDALTSHLALRDRRRVVVWSRARAGATWAERAAAAGATVAATLEDAVQAADAALSVVPGRASIEVAAQAIGAMRQGATFADLTAAAPTAKQSAAAIAEAAGVLYADVAVLGSVAVSGARVAMVAAGSGADAWQELVPDLDVNSIGSQAGRAARLKLIRSVYMKGRDALVLETMLAARRYGLEREVVASIGGPGERVRFEELADRVLRALAVHAGRRADELEASAALLDELGVEPIMTEAGVRRLRALDALGLRERFGGERPPSGGVTLTAVEEVRRR